MYGPKCTLNLQIPFMDTLFRSPTPSGVATTMSVPGGSGIETSMLLPISSSSLQGSPKPSRCSSGFDSEEHERLWGLYVTR